QLAFGVLAAAFGEADVPPELDEVVEAGDVIEDGFGLSSAARRLAALPRRVADRFEVRVEQTVNRQVGVTPDGRGEVRVVLTGQRVVPDRLGRILGAGKRFEHGEVDGERLGRPADA